jgi:hypothetical protein
LAKSKQTQVPQSAQQQSIVIDRTPSPISQTNLPLSNNPILDDYEHPRQFMNSGERGLDEEWRVDSEGEKSEDGGMKSDDGLGSANFLASGSKPSGIGVQVN